MSFTKLSADCLRKLRPSLQLQLPLTTQILNIIDLHLKEKFLRSTFSTEIYGIPDTDIINMVWTPSSKDASATTSLLHLSSQAFTKLGTENLTKAFQENIDWVKAYDFERIPSHFAPHFEKLVREKGCTIQEKIPTVFLYLPTCTIMNLDKTTSRWAQRIGETLEMDKLNETHTEKLSKTWNFGPKDGGAFLEEVINTFGCAKGIFRKGERSPEALLSWSLLLPLGTIGNLYTMEEGRGKGLARWTFEECCKLVDETHGILPCCEVELDNLPSRKLMEKIGMKEVAEDFYFKVSPPGGGKE